MLFLFVLFFPLLLNAAPVLLVDDDFRQTRLDTWLDILDNADRTITPDTILQAEFINQFAPLPMYMPSAMSHYSRYIWLRFTVYNRSDSEQRLWFSTHRGLEKQITLYRYHDGQLVQQDSAALHQLGVTPVLKKVVLDAGEEAIFFIQVNNLALHALHLELSRPQVFFQNALNERQVFSFGIGILLANALLCLVFAVYFSLPFFFWQTLYVSAVAVVMLVGLDIPAGWISYFSEWQFIAAFSAMAVSAVSALLATTAYLSDLGIAVRIRRVLYAIAGGAGVGFIVLLLSGNGYSPLLLALVSVVASSIIISGFYAWLKTRDRLVLLATLVRTVNALTIIYLLASQTWFFIQLLNPAILYCMVMETAVLTMLHLIHTYHRKTIAIRQQQLIKHNNQKNRIRSELMEEISHDIRTPLSAIVGTTDLLKNGTLTDSQQEKADMISESAQELLSYLAGMQARIQIEETAATVRKMPFELPELIESCIQAYQIQAERQQVELIVHLAADVPDVVSGDAARLQKILINLLAYLLRYSKQSEIIFRLSRQSTSGDDYLFMISGVAAVPDQEHSQADNELTIVQQLLRSLQAELSVQQLAETQEYRFVLNLPALSVTPSADSEGYDALRRKRVLVVDDNHTYCKVLKQQMSSWGLQVAEAYDGEQAIAMYRAAKNLGDAFDVLVIDFDMPQLSGLDVAARISADSATPPLMVMLTGAGATPPEQAVRTAGIAAVLHKPASQKLMRLTLTNLLMLRGRHVSGLTLEQYRILVAEDNDVSRRVISKMLDSVAVQYRLVSNGQLALEAVQRETFDLIIMDCEMPLMDGFEASRQIREWQQYSDKPQTPIIALTAHALGDYQQRCIEAGMNDFLTKPVHLSALQTMIFRYCR